MDTGRAEGYDTVAEPRTRIPQRIEAKMAIPKYTAYTAEDLKKLPLRAIVVLAARCAESRAPCVAPR